MAETTQPEWIAAVCDVKGTWIMEGDEAGEDLAVDYLRERIITPSDYIALVRWAEGRPSYADSPVVTR